MRALVTILTLLLMIGASVALYLWSQTAELQQPEAQPVETRAAEPAASPSGGITRKLTPPTVTTAITAPEPAPSSSNSTVVDFQVINGLAIAYGDVLLGKVEEGSTQTQGRYEAPVPRTWERREIPYAINPELPNPKRVEETIEYFNQNTAVKFVPYQGQPDAIVFEPGTEHCYSYLGKAGGLQPIKLAAGCQPQEIMHEVMHALGFIHEHSRTDRDQYIEVLWANINDQYKSQFFLAPEAFMEPVRGLPFDYRSIMLYAPDTFARSPGQPSIRPRSSDAVIAPMRAGLSALDVEKLRRLYSLE